MNTSGKAVMIDGCRIAWQLEGPEDAPVVLLSNSLGTSIEMWQLQIASFTKRFRVLRYDMRGHGGSDAPEGAYGLDRLGRDVLELLDALGLDHVHFCGLSLGGMIGQWLGVHAPERLDHLVLANTASFMGPPLGWQTRIDAVLENGMSIIAEAVLQRWFTPSFLASSPQILGQVEHQLRATSSIGYAGCCAAIRDMDLRPVIGQISCPTLVIAGALDPATPPLQSAAIVSAIIGAQAAELEAAHLSNVERPVEFTRAVLDFLN